MSRSPISQISKTIGPPVKNPKGNDLGDINELVLDSEGGQVVYVVVSVEHWDAGDKLFAVPYSYPGLIRRLAYRRNNKNLHVRGYKEKGSLNAPLEVAIQNETDRFSLAIDATNRIPTLLVSGALVKQKLRDMQIECRNYAYEHGVGSPHHKTYGFLHPG